MHPVLIYLTADVGCPKGEIQASLDEYRRKFQDGRAPVIYWLSWRHLTTEFGEDESAVLCDLRTLAERMGLVFFRGISAVAPPPAMFWRFESFHADWSEFVMLLPCDWRFIR